MQNFIPFENKNFEKFVTKEFQKENKEIFSIEYKGEKYWIKRGRKTSSNIFHKIFYKLLPFEVLIPVQTKSAVESIIFETEKLVRFKSLGINVPDVLGSTKDFFVLSDCGTHIYDLIRFTKDEKEFYSYLDLYILELCKIHNASEYHGGAQSRNFTFFDKKVYVIDLEDSFDEKIYLKTLQFRDLLLLLSSMTKLENIEFSYSYIINLYVNNTNNRDFLDRLRFLRKRLTLINFFGKLSLIRDSSRDAKAFFKLLDELKNV
ncbi:kinase [Halarcobacter ebronensis]|uniref:Kinase n=1 Tax=Halarcobacter ebronensis TaxID=1462615 RepID=A0A4V1LRR8_9BACT|nr:kinase [Halarcobacter ebronensis]RXJ69148.1 kinase [Halarcobacter ebronensis]